MGKPGLGQHVVVSEDEEKKTENHCKYTHSPLQHNDLRFFEVSEMGISSNISLAAQKV